MVDPERSPEPLRYTTAAAVGPEHALATWALAARERLLQAAREYAAVVASADLAEFVQRRSLIRTSQQPRHWVGDVLGRVSAECGRRGEPLLSALCVDARGHVGAAYAASVEAVTGRPVADADDHAAHERLACHRYFGAELPADGGAPVRLAPPPAARRTAASTKRSAGGAAEQTARATSSTRRGGEPKPVVTCPVHFTVLPASGVCDLCE